MEFVKNILFFVAMLIISSCGSNIQPRIAPENNVSGVKIESVGLLDINNNPIILNPISTKPRILFFASAICGTCQSEHRKLRDEMAIHGGLRPMNTDIYTIMVQAEDNLDAQDFKTITGMQWDPYYQVGDDLRNKLCGRGTPNPCVVVELPLTGIVLQKSGEVSISELQSLTGVWTW